MKRWLVYAAVLLVGGMLTLLLLTLRSMHEMAYLQVGMVELHLPSGATAYVRRQTVYDRPAELYISENSDYCAPYDRWHDYKLAEPVHGDTDSPLLISMKDHTLVIHSPKHPVMPWLHEPKSFKAVFQQTSAGEYAAGSAVQGTVERVVVPFGHNTCVL